MSEKELKIKTGVLKRYLQEVEYYRKEVQKQTDRINSMKEAPEPDQYVIKKAGEVNLENQQMLSLSLNNVKKASADLESLLEQFTDGGGIEQMKILAQELIDKAAPLLQS